MKPTGKHRSIVHYLLTVRLTVWLGVAVVMAGGALMINAYLLSSQEKDGRPASQEAAPQPISSPSVWLYHKSDHPLVHVMAVFDRLGYVVGGPGEDWDVLWAHEYPFKSLPAGMLRSLKPHQLINHFPGTGCFTSKPQLATLGLPFIPKAFRLPQDKESFKAEIAAAPGKLWVQKSNKHRGIHVKRPWEIQLDVSGYFVQEFVDRPLLIDGRKFDIGIYTAVTSVDPLRAYTYHEEVLIRFCSEDYHPFNAKNPRKYVVDDSYTPSWQIPSMAALTEGQMLSHKQALSILLRNKGYDDALVWHQALSIIGQVLMRCEPAMKSVMKRLAVNSKHFFEIVRFDFVVDEDLTVWLMEVNLSPNLSSDKVHGNRVLYEQVIFNLLSLVGLARATGRYNGEYESVVEVSSRDVQVPLADCRDERCENCQNLPSCQLCKACRSKTDSFMLQTAFLEHVNRRNFHRVLPTSHPHDNTTLSPTNLIMSVWYSEKCKHDSSWCA